MASNSSEPSLSSDFAVLCRNDLLVRNLIRKSINKMVNSARDKVDSIGHERKQRENQLKRKSTSVDIRRTYRDATKYGGKMLHDLDEMEQKCHRMIETFKQLSDEYSKEEISFDETVHLNEQKMNKVSSNIDSVIELRDVQVMQIGLTNDAVEKIDSAADEMQRLKDKLSSEVRLVEIRFTNQDNEVAELLAKSSERVARMTALIMEAKRDKLELMKAKTKLQLSMNWKKNEKQKSFEQAQAQIAEIAKQEELLCHIQNTIKKFEDDTTDEGKFKEMMSQHSEAAGKLTSDIAALQADFDKNQTSYQHLTAVKEATEKKKRELVTQLNQLDEANVEKWKLIRTVEAVHGAISLMADCFDRTPKRQRLNEPDEEPPSNHSSFSTMNPVSVRYWRTIYNDSETPSTSDEHQTP